MKVTGAGPTNSNFVGSKSSKEPTRGKDFLTGNKPKPKLTTFRKPIKQVKEDSEEELDDIAEDKLLNVSIMRAISERKANL